MKFLLNYKIFEKTSLLNIGVPFSVMQIIQKNYAISDNAQWKPLKYKKDINPILNKNKNNLIITICNNNLFVSFSYDKEYYIETYEQTIKDDFGNEGWQRIDRIKTTLSDLFKQIKKRCKSFVLVSGDWSYEFSNIRKLKNEEKDFKYTTNIFKQDFIKNYTKIYKKLYGKDSDIITNNIVKSNSLTIFDKYLIEFEGDYSDKYKEYLNIPIMIERWSRDKIMTAFMVYLYTKKLIEL